MKRYLIFSGHNYYPGGGWEDFRSSHESPDATIAALLELKEERNDRKNDIGIDWWQIVDSSTGQVILNNFTSNEKAIAAFINK